MCKYVDIDIDVYNDLYVSLALNMQQCNIMQHLLGFPSFIVAFESQGSGNWPLALLVDLWRWGELRTRRSVV